MLFLAPAPIDWVPNDPPGVWETAQMPVTFVLGSTSRDVGDAAAAEIEVALRTWTRPSCSGFRAKYGGKQGVAPGDDGINVIVFHDDAWPAELEPGAIAQTIVKIDPNGKIRDADIHLNGKEFKFSLDGAAGTQDLRSVLVHEIGHAIGLGHSLDPRATMNLSGSGLRWRSLEKDDITGICALYPGAGTAGCPADPCPSGFVCVGGDCQRPGTRGDLCSPCTSKAGCEAAGDEARCVDIESGRVCGRACAKDDDCGAGFSCKPTTEAGDKQCVALDRCKSAANPCTTDAECKDFVCRDGACVGPKPIVDAGSDAVADAGSPPTVIEPGGGCDCATTNDATSLPPIALVLATLLSARALRSRRERAQRSSP